MLGNQTTVHTMPRAKGRANYKVDVLILVVEELLSNGTQGWQEAATLYQHRSGELILSNYDDLKRHWVEKCCNKFRKPTGIPGDPKRDMILRCQRIQQRIHAKTSSTIVGVVSGGDDGLLMSDEEEEVMAVVVEERAAEVLVGGIGLGTISRIGTPTNVLDGSGGVSGGVTIHNAEEVGINPVPPLQYNTQQSTEGTFWHVPHYQQMHQQPLLLPDEILRRCYTSSPATGSAAASSPATGSGAGGAAQQPTSSQPAQLAKKKFKVAWVLLCQTKRQRTPSLTR
jgi:hypothetical protein